MFYYYDYVLRFDTNVSDPKTEYNRGHKSGNSSEYQFSPWSGCLFNSSLFRAKIDLLLCSCVKSEVERSFLGALTYYFFFRYDGRMTDGRLIHESTFQSGFLYKMFNIFWTMSFSIMARLYKWEILFYYNIDKNLLENFI